MNNRFSARQADNLAIIEEEAYRAGYQAVAKNLDLCVLAGRLDLLPGFLKRKLLPSQVLDELKAYGGYPVAADSAEMLEQNPIVMAATRRAEQAKGGRGKVN